MFSAGLSRPLTAALATLATHLPALLPEIQRRLLDAICVVLTSTSYATWSEQHQRGETPPPLLVAPPPPRRTCEGGCAGGGE